MASGPEVASEAVTTDRPGVCLTCGCPKLHTYRPTDAYCSICGHPAAQHDAPQRQVTRITAHDDLELGWQDEPPTISITPEDDDDLESGWQAALPSGRFVSVAIASAGFGLIIAGLAERFIGPPA